MAQLFHFAGDALISPGGLFSETHNSILNVRAFRWTTRLILKFLKRPFLTFHFSVPCEQRLRLHDGDNVPQPIPDRHPESNKDLSVILRQLNAIPEFASKNLVFGTEVIVLLSEFLLEEFSHSNEQW